MERPNNFTQLNYFTHYQVEGNYREHMPRPSFVYCTTSNARQNGQENFKSPNVDDARPSSVHTLLKQIVAFSFRMKPNTYRNRPLHFLF